MEQAVTVINVCPECATKESNYEQKELVLCPCCKRFVCVLHQEARLAYIIDLTSMDDVAKETREVIDLERIKKGGHPCLPYSVTFWKKFVSEKSLEMERVKNAMDGLGYYTNAELFAMRGHIIFTESNKTPPRNKRKRHVAPKDRDKEKSLSWWQKIKRVFA